VLTYDLHSSGMIGNTWKKWYGAPMAVPVAVDPFF
jgi:polar amino acid transport system substrate-binding protein